MGFFAVFSLLCLVAGEVLGHVWMTGLAVEVAIWADAVAGLAGERKLLSLPSPL